MIKAKLKLEYLLLFLILAFSAFFRLYRLDKLLGFWYDQGRDALTVWDLLHYRRFFLIGPVTGIEGIFLGPFYYYLIAPFYWLGQGSPVLVAAFLSWLTLGAIFLIYLLGKEIYGRNIGLLAAFLYGFSYKLVTFSRWLSNPNPLPFFTLMVLFFLYRFVSRKEDYSLVLAAFFIGLCLQLEAASAIWFLPATLAIVFWQKRIFKKPKVLVLAFLAFFVTLLPQIVFDFRHQGVLRAAFKKFLVADKSFDLSLAQTFKLRFLTYFDVLFEKLFSAQKWLKLSCLALFSASLLGFRKKIFTKGGKLLFIWLLMPLLGFLFYRGNYGYVWDYYFTGIIPSFMILFAAGIYWLARKNLFLKVLVVFLLILFGASNMRLIRNYHQTGVGITLRAQLKAIDWIYQDVGSEDFNVDVYVPPQIYYAYSYLFKWYGKSRYGREPQTALVKTLYTLYEPDGEHPQFLEKWLARQDSLAKIIKADYFWGDITVQKRERLNFNE
ncbi:MAG TPA: glycosyltransferase family 39 protein [Clostridia bacterium]|nr:glycosyltransferase family 39 protein [Clostridia bacterium]